MELLNCTKLTNVDIPFEYKLFTSRLLIKADPPLICISSATNLDDVTIPVKYPFPSTHSASLGLNVLIPTLPITAVTPRTSKE
jgi:hypothetical protein